MKKAVFKVAALVLLLLTGHQSGMIKYMRPQKVDFHIEDLSPSTVCAVGDRVIEFSKNRPWRLESGDPASLERPSQLTLPSTRSSCPKEAGTRC